MLLFNYLSVISLSCYSDYHVVIVHTVYMYEHLSLFTDTYWVTSDDSEFTRPDIEFACLDIGCIHVIVQVFDELVA